MSGALNHARDETETRTRGTCLWQGVGASTCSIWSQGLNEGLRGKRLADDKGYMRSLVLISLRLESDSSDPPLLKLYQVVRLLEKDAVCSAEVFQYHPSPFCGILFLEASFLICEECIKALRTVPAYSKHLINHPSPLYLTYGIHKDSCGKRFFFFFFTFVHLNRYIC